MYFKYELDSAFTTFLENASQQAFLEDLSALLGVDIEKIILDWLE